MKRSMVSGMVRPMIRSMVNSESGIVSRYFSTLDPIQQGHYTMQTAKTFAGDFEIEFDVYSDLTRPGHITLVSGENIRIQVRGTNSGSGVGQLHLDGAGFGTQYQSSTSILPHKINHIKISREGATWYLSINGVIDNIIRTTSNTLLSTIGKNSSAIGGSDFYEGVLANVTLTDLTTPSNSESWKLGNPPGTNTEQSSSGNNLLTYVNVTNRELFTEVNGDWLGAERVVNGGFDNGLAGWSVTATAPNSVTVVGGKLRIECIDGGFTGASQFIPVDRYKITGSVNRSGGSVGLQYTAAQTLTFPLGDSVINAVVTADRVLPKRDAVSVGLWDNLSFKRILEVA